jgi:thiamine-monophosphate kinase
MKVSEIGEFDLIERLAGIVQFRRGDTGDAWDHLLLGIGDDAAVWDCEASPHIVTVDASVEGVHFSLDITSWRDLGWKVLAVSLSDIAAMGGSPRYALISIALPGASEFDDVADLYRGMDDISRQFGVAVVGGNITDSPVLMIDTVVIGTAGGNGVLSRSSAQDGDVIAVTNTLGGAAAGYHMLTSGIELRPETAKPLREAFLRPVPRIAEGIFLAAQGVKAAIDLSDGLLSDLKHICVKSGVAARVNVDLLPVNKAVMDSLGGKARDVALSGGEDYELLFTARPELFEQIKRDAGFPVTEIGAIIKSNKPAIALVDSSGAPYGAKKAGWEHYSAAASAPYKEQSL